MTTDWTAADCMTIAAARLLRHGAVCFVGIGLPSKAILGAAQMDRFDNINTTVIGSYAKPKVRLPGVGGAPEIAAHVSIGFGEGGDSRKKLGLPRRGPLAVVTDLGVLRPDPVTHELVLTELVPGVTVAQVVAATGWTLRVAEDVGPMPPPTEPELLALRRLERASRAKHGHEDAGTG
jgi:glutaconate CoA-transferase subunit B